MVGATKHKVRGAQLLDAPEPLKLWRIYHLKVQFFIFLLKLDILMNIVFNYSMLVL